MFDTYTNIFCNHCLQQIRFQHMMSSRAVDVEDCREHIILMHLFTKIVVASCFENPQSFSVSSIYARDVELKEDHTFPVLWDHDEKKVYFLDALYHKTTQVVHPIIENQTRNPVAHRKLGEGGWAYSCTGSAYYKRGCSEEVENKKLEFQPTSFSASMVNNVTQFSKSLFMYGLQIDKYEPGEVVAAIADDAYQKQRKQALRSSNICRSQSIQVPVSV